MKRPTWRDCGPLVVVISFTTLVEAWCFRTDRPPLTRQYGVLLSRPSTRYLAVGALCVGAYHLLLEATE